MCKYVEMCAEELINELWAVIYKLIYEQNTAERRQPVDANEHYVPEPQQLLHCRC